MSIDFSKIKVCPICKMPKQLRFYSFYFSKARNKYRPQNYCNDCQVWEKAKRSADYFRKHRKQRLQYAKDYRADPKNKNKRKKLEVYFKKKYRYELQDCYIADYLAQKINVSAKDIRAHPKLIEDYRALLFLKRAIKQKKNEKQIY
jgi:hypothetical protein